MIVKIMKPILYDEAPIKGENNFWLFDNIKELNSLLDEDKILELLDRNKNFNKIQYFPCSSVCILCGDEKDKNLKAISMRKGNNFEAVVFNTLAYILNDAGQTIERL